MWENELYEPGKKWLRLRLEETGDDILCMSGDTLLSATSYGWRSQDFAFTDFKGHSMYTIKGHNFLTMTTELGI